MDPAIKEKPPVEPSLLIDSLFAEIHRKFERRPDELIPMLQRVQKALGFLPDQALIEIARLTGLPAAKVFGTATFYAQFRFEPAGKHTIRVCRGTACHVKGSDRMLEDIRHDLGVTPGIRTEDGLFTLETVACFGSCALAPILVLDDTVYGSMNRSRALKLIDDIHERELAVRPGGRAFG